MGEPLQQFSEGSRLRIVRVEDAGTDFLNQLDQLNISLGKEFTLKIRLYSYQLS